VLLIIFMVTARMIVTQSLPVNLPGASHGSEPPAGALLRVTLAADGTARVNDEPVANDDAILALAKTARDATPELHAEIEADRDVRHGRFVHVLDLLKEAHVTRIGIGVTPAEQR
jgi:biopolymer transport protein ExbD